MKITKFLALMCAVATFAFVGCEPSNDEEGQPNEPSTPTTGTITLTADKTTVALGDVVKLTVTQEGVDVTAQSTIYDNDTMNKVQNGEFLAAATGHYTFFATKGSESSNYVYITVMATSVPELPEDSDVANTKFNHRLLLVDHTGINCGYCPMMIDNLLAFEEQYPNWASHLNEVTCHAGSMAGGDPANSPAANTVNQFYKPDGYPNLSINFHSATIGNYQQGYFLQLMDQTFAELVNVNGADAGIAIATSGDSETVYASVSVKAAVEQEYKVTAWLLESKIYGNQAGASADYHKLYNHALRNVGGSYNKNDLSGDSVGVIKAGETAETAFELPITSSKWKVENMDVLVIVSAKDKTKRWEVVNTAICPVNSSVNYEYL